MVGNKRTAPRVRKGTPAQFDRAFRPVALEIGVLTREWNQLQEELGQIFARLISPDKLFVGLAAWHSQKSDRTQRDMLRATATAWYHDHRSPYSKSLKPCIIELLNQVDRFAFARNSAIHAPINLLMDTVTFEFRVEPNYWWGNPLAKKLNGKDVAAEFSWYSSKTKTLRQYALGINAHLLSGRLPLPDKLVLPLLRHSPSRKTTHRKTISK
jgi:hypothetical protein